MRKPATILAALGIGIAAASLGANPAFAVPITYTEQTVGSGSLDGVAFTDATVVLTMINDTANVTGGPTFFTNVGTATVSVAGAAPETFTNTIEVFSNQAAPASVGFADLGVSFDILDDVSASFATYELTTEIGPIVGTPDISPPIFFPDEQRGVPAEQRYRERDVHRDPLSRAGTLGAGAAGCGAGWPPRRCPPSAKVLTNSREPSPRSQRGRGLQTVLLTAAGPGLPR